MLTDVLEPTAPRSTAARTGKPVLIVVHGPGRGRHTEFVYLLLEEILRARAELRGLIRIHRTGDPAPAIDRFSALVFLLGDPLEQYPECQAEALSLASAARRRGIRILNPPEALNNTSKSRQSGIWRRAGIPCAAAASAPDEPVLRDILERAFYPIIFRFDSGHTQQGMFAAGDKAFALSCLPKVRYPAVVLPFIDTRASWREQKPDSIMARYFHKKRSMVFPNAVFNNHIFFSPTAIVGDHSSTFRIASDGEAPPDLDEMIAADIEYSFAPPEQPELMQAAVRALGLDMAAIDYSTLADGRVVLWEANPYFALPHWTKAMLPEARRLKDRNPRYVTALVDELAALTGMSRA